MRKALSNSIGFVLALFFILYVFGFYGLIKKTVWKKDPALIITMVALNTFALLITFKLLKYYSIL